MPRTKALQDKFRDTRAARKEENVKNEHALVILEDISTTQVLIDKLMLKMKNFAKAKVQNRAESTAAEKIFTTARENDRVQAHMRWNSDVASPTPKKKQKGNEDDKFNEWMLQMKEEFAEDRDLRKSELELREKRFEEEKKEREASRAQHAAT